MISTPLRIIQLVTPFAWPVLMAIMLTAAILFVRIDRRAHTLCLVVGCAIQVLVALWRLPIIRLVFSPREIDPMQIQNSFIIQSGFNLIGSGLICYGFFTMALIQFRKSRLPRFEGEASD